MLRVSFKEEGGKLTVTLEGRLSGMWAQELREAVLRAWSSEQSLLVELGDVTFADEEGEEVLKWISGRGGRFIAGTAFSSYLCDQLGILSASPQRTDDSQAKRSRKGRQEAGKTNSREKH
jgi:hypothetical protein